MPLPLSQTLDAQETTAAEKAALARTSLPRYLVMSALAGAYVGIAVMVLLATASAFITTKNSGANLVKGSVFGIALTLVVFAGAELFTGVVPAMLQGLAARKTSMADLAIVWVASWIGNLAGSLLFAAMVNASGVFSTGAAPGAKHTVVYTALSGIIKAKVALTTGQLFWRAVLCNFLVCLGLWMAARASSDAAKAIVLWWVLLAFIATGLEHSVANETIFGIAIFAHVPGATAAHFATNLLWVTLGNIVGGGLLVGLAYSYVGRAGKRKAPSVIVLPAGPAGEETVSVTAASTNSASLLSEYDGLDDNLLFEDDYVIDDAELVTPTTTRTTTTRTRAARAPASTRTRTVTKAVPAARNGKAASNGKTSTTPSPRTRSASTRSR